MNIDYREPLNERVKKFIDVYCVNNKLWPHVFGTLYVTGALQIQYNGDIIMVGNPYAQYADASNSYCILCGEEITGHVSVDYYETHKRKFGLYKCQKCKHEKLCTCCLLSTRECTSRKITAILALKSLGLYRDIIKIIVGRNLGRFAP
jgi:hypothetical protein